MSSTDMVHNADGARHIATLLCGIAETQPIHAQHNLHLLLPLLEAEVRRIASFTSMIFVFAKVSASFPFRARSRTPCATGSFS